MFNEQKQQIFQIKFSLMDHFDHVILLLQDGDTSKAGGCQLFSSPFATINIRWPRPSNKGSNNKIKYLPTLLTPFYPIFYFQNLINIQICSSISIKKLFLIRLKNKYDHLQVILNSWMCNEFIIHEYIKNHRQIWSYNS